MTRDQAILVIYVAVSLLVLVLWLRQRVVKAIEKHGEIEKNRRKRSHIDDL